MISGSHLGYNVMGSQVIAAIDNAIEGLGPEGF